MVNLPLGNFARSRRDWNVESLRYGSAFTNGSGNFAADSYSLNNNAKDGTYLALYGILAFCMKALPVMGVSPQPNVFGASNGFAFQLNPNAPAIPGFVNFTNGVTSGWLATNSLFIIAEGKEWFCLPDAPLFLIPPNQSVVVQTMVPQGQNPGVTTSWCSFLWGTYRTGKTPRRNK